MKKVWIFFCLAGSYCQKWLFWSLGGMIAVQSLVFGLGVSGVFTGQFTNPPVPLAFDQVIGPTWMQYSFVAAMMILVIRMNCLGAGSKGVSFLLQRIDTPKYQISLGFFLYAMVALFLLWAVQVAMLWVFALLYGAIEPTMMGLQTLFLLTNNVDFLHVLLPTLDTSLVGIRLLAWLALSAALSLGWQKRALPIAAFAVVLILFASKTIGCIAVIVSVLVQVYYGVIALKEGTNE